MDTTADAVEIFKEAVSAVQPKHLLPQHLSVNNDTLTVCGKAFAISNIRKLKLIAIGKAAAAMAQTVETILGNTITEGICITKYGHSLPLRFCKIIEAAHPVPDENSIAAGKEVVKMLQGLTEQDIVLVLISGGASSLMVDVPSGCNLQQLQYVFDALVNSGADITEINTVRKHLSSLKGGGLARAAYPATVVTLILSDVVGDAVDVIASGPTVPNTTTFEDASAVLEKYHLWNKLPQAIKTHLEKGRKGEVADTPKTGDDIFKNSIVRIIGSNSIALHAACKFATQKGYHALIYKENVTGDTSLIARNLVRHFINYNGPLPACILLGGETTLKVVGSGLGGRNQHFVLCALDEMLQLKDNEERTTITILSAGTDGTDGPTDATGAVALAGPHINEDHEEVKKALQNFDSYHFFEQRGGLIKTGPTQTNVVDIIMLLITD